MDLARKNGRMVLIMKVTLNLVVNMVKEFINGQMKVYMMDYGSIII